MTAKDMIRANMALGDQLVAAYLGDLTDADLLVRPVEGMNTIAWQLGHIISGERMFAEMVQAGSSPELPASIAGKYDGPPVEGAVHPPKEEFLSAWKAQRAATLAVLEEASDARLGEDSGVSYAPKIVDVLNLVGNHVLMHAGQWVAVRRALKKPITI